jgi:hypothetical protein
LDTKRWEYKGSNAPSLRISSYCGGKLSINRLIGGVLAKKPIFRGEGRGNLKQKPEEEMRTNFPLTVRPQSLYRSRAGRHFYGAENEICAGFGLIGNTEKKNWGPIMSNFWGCFFHVFRGKKII